jgi:hypothetical protein
MKKKKFVSHAILPALYKFVFPQVGKKFLPGDGQDVVGKGTDRVLADQDEILKYTFKFIVIGF